ncbi:MAG: hypothetical protein WBJ36_04545 [Tenuifilum sp.]|uniref:hypothetical protein n=1 Tax=Tenuifilum sp. TaxID=2760880 RepID=UPI003C9316B0
MTINRNNYEHFIIDYIDGKLSPELTDELMVFLNQNPDIALEVDGLAEIKLNPTPVKAPMAKESLKRSTSLTESGITEADYLCIAELENDLTAHESLQLNELKKNHPDIARLSTLYSRTKLIANPAEIFPRKASLKHARITPTLSRIAYATVSIAAVLLIGIYINSLLISRMDSNTMVAVQSPTTTPEQENNKPAETIELTKPIDNTVQETRRKPNLQYSKPATTVRVAQVAQITETTNRVSDEEIEPIATIEPQVTQTPQQEAQPNISINKSNSLTTQGSISAKQVQPQTKELTLGDIALKGVQKLAQSVGINVDVKQTEGNQAKKIVVESRLLAVSATILPKEE